MVAVCPDLRDGVLRAGGLPLADLADRFGTPTYVYDADVIRDRYRRLRDPLTYDGVNIYFSIKAHPTVAILQVLRHLGAGADCCSPGDLAFAQRAGWTGQEISYAGCGVTDAELSDLLAVDVGFIAGSIGELGRYCRAVPGRPVGIRVNVGIEAGFHPHVQAGAAASKFGVAAPGPAFDEARRLAASHGTPIVGVHGHLGSDLLDPGPHLRLLDRLLALAPGLPDLQWVDIGGGWGIPFGDDDTEYDVVAFGAAVVDRMTRARRRWPSLELRLEPGAYLLMDAAVLLATVTDVRPSDPGRPNPLVVVDTSTNHLISLLLYGTQRPIWNVHRPSDPVDELYDICGNLMQAGDILGREVPIPDPAIGDVLAFGKVGAYAACRASTFNERERPAEVLVDGGSSRLVRRHETVADLMHFEVTDERHPI